MGQDKIFHEAPHLVGMACLSVLGTTVWIELRNVFLGSGTDYSSIEWSLRARRLRAVGPNRWFSA